MSGSFKDDTLWRRARRKLFQSYRSNDQVRFISCVLLRQVSMYPHEVGQQSVNANASILSTITNLSEKFGNSNHLAGYVVPLLDTPSARAGGTPSPKCALARHIARHNVQQLRRTGGITVLPYIYYLNPT